MLDRLSIISANYLWFVIIGIAVAYFLNQAITPPKHEVLLIDGNAWETNEQDLARALRIAKGDA
jgi:hypothetical protein